MKALIEKNIQESIDVKTQMLSESVNNIEQIGRLLADAISRGNKLMFCGNGGSAADAQHLVAELIVRFRSHVNRPAIAALALTVDPSIMTAGSNDIGFENVFARQIEGLGKSGDVLIGISTSGNSQNVINATKQAKKQEITTIALLGGNGGELAQIADYSMIVPSNTTARIQEAHITIGHIWCNMIEDLLYSEYIKTS